MDDKIQPVPQQPEIDGDIPQYDGKASISLGTLASEGINWIKPIDSNLLVADRVLLTKVSWEDLDKDGLVAGKTVLLNGQHFRCRLLQVGDEEGVPNEWDKVLYKTVGDNSLWHWENIFFGEPISQLMMCRIVRFGGITRPASGTTTMQRVGTFSWGSGPPLSPCPLTPLLPILTWTG